MQMDISFLIQMKASYTEYLHYVNSKWYYFKFHQFDITLRFSNLAMITPVLYYIGRVQTCNNLLQFFVWIRRTQLIERKINTGLCEVNAVTAIQKCVYTKKISDSVNDSVCIFGHFDTNLRITVTS